MWQLLSRGSLPNACARWVPVSDVDMPRSAFAAADTRPRQTGCGGRHCCHEARCPTRCPTRGAGVGPVANVGLALAGGVGSRLAHSRAWARVPTAAEGCARARCVRACFPREIQSPATEDATTPVSAGALCARGARACLCPCPAARARAQLPRWIPGWSSLAPRGGGGCHVSRACVEGTGPSRVTG